MATDPELTAPPTGPIVTRLRTLRPEHRARYKAEQIAGIMRPRIKHISPLMDITVRGQPWKVIINSIKQGEPPDDNCLILDITVWDIDRQPRKFSNPWVLRNPPVMVPTGQKQNVTNHDGETSIIDVMIENPIEALRLALQETVSVTCPHIPA